MCVGEAVFEGVTVPLVVTEAVSLPVRLEDPKFVSVADCEGVADSLTLAEPVELPELLVV